MSSRRHGHVNFPQALSTVDEVNSYIHHSEAGVEAGKTLNSVPAPCSSVSVDKQWALWNTWFPADFILYSLPFLTASNSLR